MIIVTLMGGLGNQMFQYAFGKRLSVSRGTSLKIDLSFLLDKTANHTIRKYELEIFNLEATVANEEDLNIFKKVSNNKIKRIIQRIFPFLLPYYTVREQTHSFDPSILQPHKNTLAIGFWQTERYFSEIAGTIRKDFSFPPITDEVNKVLANKIASCNSVGIHVRRGDYVSNPETNKFHGVCGIEYYNAALNLISEKVPGSEFFVFSDDTDWVKQNLNSNRPITYITHNNGDKAYLDMQLMSLCKHNIIANSSFSWWGAWLNSNTNKIVIAPKKWFNDVSIDTSDIIPETWIKL